MEAQVIVKSVPGTKYTQEIHADGHVLYGDEPELVGGNDKGPSPYRYLLAALGT